MIRPPVVLAVLALASPVRGEDSIWTGVASTYCMDCHDGESKKGGLDFEAILDAAPGLHSEQWEKVVRQLRARQMPPLGKDRPDAAGYDTAAAALEAALDAAAVQHPNPGRTDTLRRLNRAEYANAVRDLLDLEIDSSALLPADESSHGFDNVTVAGLSPALLDRYITAAQKISRLAVGRALREPAGRTVRVPPDRTQEGHVEGLPLGTRGGVLIRHTFPCSGEYEVRVRLTRDRNEEVEGLRVSHELEVLLDGEREASFKVTPPPNRNDHTQVDAHLSARFVVDAGPREVGVTFVKGATKIGETLRQPYQSHFNMHRHPRLSPAVYQVTITGPFGAGATGDTPSRRRVFITDPQTAGGAEAAAKEILSALMRRAYRRPVVETDLARPLDLFHAASAEGGFEAGIEAALAALLVSREFLFRVERDPPGAAPGTPYSVSDLELASRLSFFLWSSIPDEELLGLAERGELGKPDTLAAQARRMLADPRSRSLVENFAGQWLYLRNLKSFVPDGRLFPDFDDNLRQSMRRETELLFESVLREDRSVLDLLRSETTFLNERLAKHYGIPNVYGERFRPVAVTDADRRGGLLRHGSILTVTSYATRTSPVIRGHWVLKNLLGTPPPPPPPDVPALDDNTVSAALPMRQRLAAHRENAACARCHDVMDPVGFALENYDALGRWRTRDGGLAIDASGALPATGEFAGVGGLEAALLERPEIFARTLTEKLLTYALGRGVEHYDAPGVRQIVRQAAAEDFRFSAIILGIVRSNAFRMRNSE